MTNLEIIATVMTLNKITEELHTFSRWKSMGYSVKKGEHGIETRLWKFNTKAAEAEASDDDDEDTKQMHHSGYYLAKSFLFKRSQVEEINNAT